jgi:hypothetical protein
MTKYDFLDMLREYLNGLPSVKSTSQVVSGLAVEMTSGQLFDVMVDIIRHSHSRDSGDD